MAIAAVAHCKDAAAFKEAVRKQYSGDNYLETSIGF